MFDDSLTKMECFRKLPMYNIKKSWNSLKESLKKEYTFEGFKTKLQMELIKRYLNGDEETKLTHKLIRDSRISVLYNQVTLR